MRLYRLNPSEVEDIVHAGRCTRTDKRGRPIFIGRSSDGRLVEVVVALDIPDHVITVIGETR
jgi:hypothetical protein